MRKVLGAMAVLAVIAAGCGSEKSSQPSAARPAATPTPTPAPTVQGFEKGHSRAVRSFYGGGTGQPADPAGDVEAEYHQPPRPARGGIGDTITLTGTNIGVRLEVTLTGLVDPAGTKKPPREGMRYVGVGLRLRGTGIAIHDNRLTNALLYHGPRRPAEPVFGVEAGCSHGFEGVVRVDDSAPARGCLLFQVPENADPRRLQLALEQVPVGAGGVWRLR